MRRSSGITWDQLKVGAAILVALVIMGVAILKLGQSAHLFSQRYKLVSFVPNTAGLRVGGQVTVAGQLAGAVKSIARITSIGGRRFCSRAAMKSRTM